MPAPYSFLESARDRASLHFALSQPQAGRPWWHLVLHYGPIASVFLLAITLTGASFMADTIDYAASVTNFEHGRLYEFWDAGHLLWRPLGWSTFHLLRPATKLIGGPDDRSNSIVQLISLNIFAGFICVILFYALLVGFGIRQWIVNIVTTGFILSNAFLNYVHTGCAYIPGLCAVLLAVYLLALRPQRPAGATGTAMLSGIVLAIAVCFWLPYILVVPAVLLFPLARGGWGKYQWHRVTTAAIAAAVVAVLCYGAVIHHLQLNSVTAIRAWVNSASHGVTHTAGISRFVFGFAGSFINMGDDGPLFKRYLLHDPFNPVSFTDLFRVSLGKLSLFYAVMAELLLSLWRSGPGRRLSVLFAISAIPVLSFGMYWQGGDMERYLPLYPFLFLIVAHALEQLGSSLQLKLTLLLFLAVMAVSNTLALSRTTLQHQQRALQAELDTFRPHLNRHSIVLVPPHSKFVAYMRDNPPDASSTDVRFNEIVEMGKEESPYWRENIASLILSIWANGGDVWASTCLFDSRPQLTCGWVEGEDQRVPWSDVYQFFAHLQTDERLSGKFVLVLPSSTNREFSSVLSARASK